MRNDFSRSVLFTNDLFLSKNIPQVTANRWEQKSLAGAGTQGMCTSNAQKTAGSTKEEGKSILLQGSNHKASTRAGTLSAVWDTKHSLTPQDTVNKKLLSLESQQDNDGRRLGLSNERNSPSEPC